MLSNWKRSPYAPPVLFISKRTISLAKKMYRFEPPVRFVSKRVISLEVKAVDRYVPDSILLLFTNTLDKRVPPDTIEGVISGLDALPPKLRSSMITAAITAADNYIPDTAASSRKVSAVFAAIYKYIPDRIIPPEASENWSNIKTKFHIPTLLSRGQNITRKD